MSLRLRFIRQRYLNRRRLLPVWRRLRRQGSMTLLLFAFALGIGDPLACILHCPLWTSIVPTSLPGHEHHGHVMASDVDAPAITPVKSTKWISPQVMACHLVLLDGGLADGMSGNLMPQPDHLAAMSLLVLALFVALQLRRRAHMRPPILRSLARPPDLRPPIACVP